MRSIDDHGGGGTRAVDDSFGSSSQKATPHATWSAPDRTAECSNETDCEQKGFQRQRSILECDLEQLWRWNAVVPENIQRCVHDIISEQTRTRPQNVAVQSWDGSLTYSRLDTLSSLLALHLRFLGVGTCVTVPLCFEKSMWAVVALLAVMKTEAAFS